MRERNTYILNLVTFYNILKKRENHKLALVLLFYNKVTYFYDIL